MDLALSPQDEAFRDEVHRFLDENLTEDLREAGRKTGGVFADVDAGLRWHKVLATRGWSAPTRPTEYGGTGWTATQRYIFARECIAVDAPRIFAMGIRMVGPVIMKFGTPEQKAKYLPRIVSGDIVFCQGYSEPGSGSDLASLKTRAVRDGDDYVINGTKIWTTGAHVADHMFCLVRTATEGKPQDGISFVLIDSMTTPGLSVKPGRSPSTCSSSSAAAMPTRPISMPASRTSGASPARRRPTVPAASSRNAPSPSGWPRPRSRSRRWR
jgi:alkylation response protein AidB-like acyl-CoA dehydrogenase